MQILREITRRAPRRRRRSSDEIRRVHRSSPHCQSHSPIAPVDYAQFIPLTFNGEFSLRLVALARRSLRRRTENVIQQPKGCTLERRASFADFFSLTDTRDRIAKSEGDASRVSLRQRLVALLPFLRKRSPESRPEEADI